MMSRFAIAAAQHVGWPEYVWPWRNHRLPPSSRGVQNGSATRPLTTTPPSGRYPLVTPLANVIMSGRRPKRSTPNHVPSRPNAAITQSATNSAP